MQKILLAWVFRWHLVDLPPSRVFSAADAALSLGAESGKSKECRGMCFSRIRSKGSRFTLGVWGVEVCSLDVPQPFATATVHGRSREARMAVPMASSAKVVTFGGFKCRVASF